MTTFPASSARSDRPCHPRVLNGLRAVDVRDRLPRRSRAPQPVQTQNRSGRTARSSPPLRTNAEKLSRCILPVHAAACVITVSEKCSSDRRLLTKFILFLAVGSSDRSHLDPACAHPARPPPCLHGRPHAATYTSAAGDALRHVPHASDNGDRAPFTRAGQEQVIEARNLT